MIEGMEILNKTEITEIIFPDWICPILFIGFIVAVILGLFLSFYFNSPQILIGVGFLYFLFCGLVAGVGYSSKKEDFTGRYRYEVTLSDDVSIKAIYEQYNVIEVRGDIFILEDKVISQE